MKAWCARGVLIACVGAAVGVAAQQPPTFRGGSDVVRVFVTAIDKDGRLVTTLTRENFEVRDEGHSQPITQFDNKPQPVRLIVMLDVSGSMPRRSVPEHGDAPMQTGVNSVAALLGLNADGRKLEACV